jgi:glycosyltransferase involved in cell wall biosynthesis
VNELLEEERELGAFVFDPNDADGLASLILRTLENREEALAIQRAAYDRLRQRDWSHVAVAYAEAAVAGPVVEGSEERVSQVSWEER